jgi:hypothetical protein
MSIMERSCISEIEPLGSAARGVVSCIENVL